ncbi:MAG: YbaB/EbfC family nucleoid-associated protein [Bacteroidota bacterium]
MFGDLFGNVEQQQKELQEKLSKIEVKGEAGDGAIQVTANANQKILNISIDKSKLDWEDSEEVEDLLLVAINRTLEKAMAKQGEESQKLLQNMMPPGMGGLADMFGK